MAEAGDVVGWNHAKCLLAKIWTLPQHFALKRRFGKLNCSGIWSKESDDTENAAG